MTTFSCNGANGIKYMQFHFLYITTTRKITLSFSFTLLEEPLFGTENKTNGGQNTGDSGELQ